MKNIKIFILFALSLIFAIISAGCSESYDSGASNNYNKEIAPAEMYYDYEAGYDEYDAGNTLGFIAPGDTIVELYEEASGGGAYSGVSASANIPPERKIIRDADITMEVGDVEKAYASILARVADLGGYEANRNMHNQSYDGQRSYPTVSATLKIPAYELDEFLESLTGEGEIISSYISSSDITEQYFDAQIKLTTLEKTLENYYRFLEEALDIDEQLRITRYINDTTREIEQLKGSLRRWDSLVEYSTVSLHLYRPYEAPVPEREINWNSLSLEDMGWFISSGFLSVINAILSGFQWFIIAVATASPILIPLVIALVLLIRRRRKNKKKYIQEAQAQKQDENAGDGKNNNL